MNELQLVESIDDPKIKGMIAVIEKNMPMITKATKHFGKRQSEFMDNNMTLHHPTPYRNMRQILAEIEKSKEALRESHFKIAIKKQKMKIREIELASQDDILQRDLIKIELEKDKSDIEHGMVYHCGAIRKIANYIKQYNSIIDQMKKERGVDELTEEDFEDEEEKYHIKTAFAQALTAARSRGGVIDEGNHIYFHQLGINGMVAQNHVSRLLHNEKQILESGGYPSHKMVLLWLQECYLLHKGCAKEYAKERFLTT